MGGTREFLEFRMRNFQDIVFIWTQTNGEIFKSALEVPLTWKETGKIMLHITATDS